MLGNPWMKNHYEEVLEIRKNSVKSNLTMYLLRRGTVIKLWEEHDGEWGIDQLKSTL